MGGIKVTMEERRRIFHIQNCETRSQRRKKLSFLLPIAQMREKPANEEKFAEIVQLCNSEVRFMVYAHL